MKEDILEQLVDDYLQTKNYFTCHNVKFRPREDHPNFQTRQDSNHSDIDVIGYNPHLRGAQRIWVVSCKSWQAGFPVETKITELEENKIRSGRESWKAFRELMDPKWTEAFFDAVQHVAGSAKFTYVTAVTHIKGNKKSWENHDRFRRAMRGNPLTLICLKEMLGEILPQLGTTVAPSNLGRTLQLFRAAGYLD